MLSVYQNAISVLLVYWGAVVLINIIFLYGVIISGVGVSLISLFFMLLVKYWWGFLTEFLFLLNGRIILIAMLPEATWYWLLWMSGWVNGAFLNSIILRCVFAIVILTGPLFKRASLNSEVLPCYSDAVIQNSFIRVSAYWLPSLLMQWYGVSVLSAFT